MDYAFKVPDHEDLNLALRSGGIFSGIKLIHNGQIIKPIKRKYHVRKEDGQEIILALKYSIDFFHPKISYGDKIIRAFPVIPTYILIIAYLPLLLLFTGGAIGGLIGGLGAAVNFSILERKISTAAKIIANFVILLISFVLYTVVATIVLSAINN